MPRVSVAIPTYNRSAMLARAISSVLGQTCQDFEIVVVDDGSTDDTEERVASFEDPRIKYTKLEANSGGSYLPRTTATNMASGEYIAMLDADCYWTRPDKLELQVEFLDRHPDHALVGTYAILEGNGRKTVLATKPVTDTLIRKCILAGSCFFHPSVLCRKSTFDSAGGYDRFPVAPYNRYSNDYGLWLKLGLLGKMANLPVYGVGITPTTFSKNNIKGFTAGFIGMVRPYKGLYPSYYLSLLKWRLLWLIGR